MSVFSFIFRRLRALFRNGKLERDMTEEMCFHLDERTADNIAEGLAPDEARYAAQRSFGGVEQIKERARDERGWMWLERGSQDFRFGTRLLRKSPGFTAVAILTLTIAIGVNSAIFSLINSVLLRPAVPYKPDEVVCIFTTRQDAARAFRQFSYAEFTTLRESHEVFADVAAVNFNYVSLGRDEGLRRIFAFMVSDNYFSLMGAKPATGRFFTTEETRRIIQDSSGRCHIAPLGPQWSPMKSFGGLSFDSCEGALAEVQLYFRDR